MRNLLLIVFFLFLPFQTFAEVKIIEVKHRAAADLETQVRELLDEDEKVQAAGGHLILVAHGESLQAAEQLITLLDRPLVNLLIRVRQSDELQRVGQDSSAKIRYGNKTNLSTSSTLGFKRGNSTTHHEQTLRLVEGGRGLIEVGQDIPFTQQWAAVTGDQSGYSESVDYKTIATGFWVNPVQMMDEKVLIDIEPYISSAEQSSAKAAPQIEYSQLRTRLIVPIGQWYPLGQQLRQHNEVSRAIISWRSSSGQAEKEIQIRIDTVE